MADDDTTPKKSRTTQPPKIDLKNFNFMEHTVSELQDFSVSLKHHLKNRSNQLTLDFQKEVEELRKKKGLPESVVKVKVPKDKSFVYAVKGTDKGWDAKSPNHAPNYILQAAQDGKLVKPGTEDKILLKRKHNKPNPKTKNPKTFNITEFDET